MSEVVRTLTGGEAVSGPSAPRALAAFGAVLVGTALVLAIFGPTFKSMVEIWHRSDTFAHGFLVIPVFVYLAWQQREALAAADARPFWPGLLAVALFGFAWLLSELAGALAPAQFAMVALVPAALLTAFGWRWLWILAFPLAFLFFAVPFGEALVPTLVDWTADFTVAALRLSGVPVYREGAHFVLPTGNWSVVEGCSGIRYLIASLVTGCLFAWVMYRSPRRRALFIVAAIVVPLIANWLRAYLIVMIGHLSDNRIATGVDHLIYGWIFFSIVIVALFAVGARWREDPAEASAQPPGAAPSVAPARRFDTAPLLALVVAVVLAAAWPVAKAALERVPAQPHATLQRSMLAGWTPSEPFTSWRAVALGPVGQQVDFVSSGETRAAMQVVLYRDQHQGSELVTSGNRLVADDNPSHWHVTAERTGSIEINGRVMAYREALVRADRLLAVRQWYWLDGDTTTSDVRAKISLAFDRLLIRSDASAWVLVFTPVDQNLNEGRETLDRLMRAVVPALQPGLEEWSR